MNLLVGIPGRPKRLKFFYKQEAGRGHGGERALLIGSHRVLLGYDPPFPLIFLNLEGEWVQNKKGNKVLDREVNHKLSFRGTWFYMDGRWYHPLR